MRSNAPGWYEPYSTTAAAPTYPSSLAPSYPAHARFVAAHLVGDRCGKIGGDLAAAVAAVAEARPGPIRWIGLGPDE
jgi:hypothetical protein